MNLSKYWSDFPRSPDEPAAPEAQELVPEVHAEESGPQPEATPDEVVHEPVKPEAPAMVPLRVLQERVGEETTRRQAAEEESRRNAEKARNFEEIVKRLQSEPKSTDPVRPAPETRVESRTETTDQTAVQQEAARLLFQRDLQNVSEAGIKAYGPRWADAVNALTAYGANSTDFVANVMEIDPVKAHDIMFQIAQDGERAVALARMTPTRRIAEITRMVMADVKELKNDAKSENKEPKPDAKAEPEGKAISRAPAPKPALAPRAAAPEVDPTTPEGNEKMDDAAWSAWYKNKYMKRSA